MKPDGFDLSADGSYIRHYRTRQEARQALHRMFRRGRHDVFLIACYPDGTRIRLAYRQHAPTIEVQA